MALFVSFHPCNELLDITFPIPSWVYDSNSSEWCTFLHAHHDRVWPIYIVHAKSTMIQVYYSNMLLLFVDLFCYGYRNIRMMVIPFWPVLLWSLRETCLKCYMKFVHWSGYMLYVVMHTNTMWSDWYLHPLYCIM